MIYSPALMSRDLATHQKMAIEPEKEKKEKGRGKERLTRLVIVGIVALLVVVLVRALIKDKSHQTDSGALISFSLKDKMENLGENVLGAAVKLLPDAPTLEEVGDDIQTDDKDQPTQAGEPIEQPTENIKKQTELLLEMIKDLPQDQIRAIKKQIYKDFCQGVLGEEDEQN